MALPKSQSRAIVGKGGAFPFGFSGGATASNGGVETVEDIEAIKASLTQVIGCAIGSRIMRRNYGSGLKDLVFEPNQPEFELFAEHVIREGVAAWERRVVLGPITYDRVDKDKGRIYIDVEFTVIKTQVTSNLIYPYYLNGAQVA